MSCDGSPKFLPGPNGKGLSTAVKLAAGDVRASFKMSLPVGKSLTHIFLQFVFRWVGAENKGSTEICLPVLEDRTKIQEKNVIRSDSQLRRILCIRQQGASASADDSFVPITSIPYICLASA